MVSMGKVSVSARGGHLHRLVVVLTLSLTLASCSLGPPALRASFVDYSSAYADTSNRQLLLNLARGANHHPPYFLQLANITTTYQFGSEATLGGTAGKEEVESVRGTELGAEVGIGGTYGEQPTFDFTPLSGKSFAQVVLSPISQQVFFSLYEQGFPADMLLRAIVLSITFEFPTSGRRVVLENIPDLERPERFLDFLRLAAILRQLQLEQAIYIDRDGEGNPFFGFTNESDAIIAGLLSRPEYRFSNDLGADLGGQGRERRQVALKMRTFASVLRALSTEYQLFDAVIATEPTALETIPTSQRQPILRFSWNPAIELTAPVAVVDYLGQRYEIADPISLANTTRRNWNRRVFTLLLGLYSQVSLDPSELPTSNFFRVLP